MSQPSLGGTLPQLVVENGVARVTDTGDFFTQEGDPVTHRCLLILNSVDGLVFGTNLGKSTQADQGMPPGAGTRDEVAAMRVPLRPGAYRWYVWGGLHSRYVRSDGTVAYDVYEWGNYDLVHPERVATGTITVSGAAAPPPAPKPPPAQTVTLDSAQAKARAALYELVEVWRARGDTDAQIASTLVYRTIKALGSTGTLRAQIREALGKLVG